MINLDNYQILKWMDESKNASWEKGSLHVSEGCGDLLPLPENYPFNSYA